MREKTLNLPVGATHYNSFRMEQIKIIEEQKQIKSCVFTGHRELGEDFSLRKLKKEIEKSIQKGVDTFYNGMAMGFDLISAECVLKLKKKYPHIKLFVCIPCYGQERAFSQKDKKRYVKIYQQADEKVILSDNYYRGCMLVRDKYMAERADMMITYCKKKEGGTAYTVNCFKKLKPDGEIVYIE